MSGNTCFTILNELLESPDYTTNLSNKLKIESSVITHALKKLEKNNLVDSYREKKLKYYQLKDKGKIQKLFKIVGDISNGRS
ncbi:MAG: winged helix-turn-helix domain-containing protein [Spirochaetota bacterium]